MKVSLTIEDLSPEFVTSYVSLVQTLVANQEKIMATLDQILDEVATENTTIASVQTLITGLQTQVAAVLAGALTPAQQAKVDQIFSNLQTNDAALATALASNVTTPPTTPPLTNVPAPVIDPGTAPT